MRVIRIDSIKTFEDVRGALQKVKEAFDSSVVERGDWVFFSISINAAVTELKYSHSLNFIPKDVIQLSVSNHATVTWHYDSFDANFLVISTTGRCVIRAYVGRHLEGNS